MNNLEKILIIIIAFTIIGFFIEVLIYIGMLIERRKYIVQIDPKVDLTSNTSEYNILDIKV